MLEQAVTPHQILADGADTTLIGGKEVRKGTVAAFLANIEILESDEASGELKKRAAEPLASLAPDVVTIGLTRHVVFKNEFIQDLLLKAEHNG